MLTISNYRLQYCADRVIPEKAVHLEPPCCTIKSRNTTRGIKMKICSTCKQTKSLSEFHKNKHCKDGHLCSCRICRGIYAANYQRTTKGKATQKRYEQTEKGKATRRAVLKRFYTRHPERKNATTIVSNAIRDGKLPRPDTLQCHYGNHPAQQYHHWHGYEKEYWLDVVPVCKDCHIKCRKKIA